jgi:site-specific DNA recombinase
MIAAIYARKSTDQTGIAEEQRSVARQIDHAQQYARRKGWIVADEHLYIDDGISGAEFTNRPGFLRLMNAVKPRPPFQVLVMSEESRLGREAIETAYALKQLITAGVRVFFYLEDRERTLDSPTDKIMLSLTTFADELEREKARQRTSDAMLRIAKAGHVAGGRVFGYDNVEVHGPDGKRSHSARRINDQEAAVVRRIFELYAAGTGYTRIAKRLNGDGVPAPRPQQGRPAGCCRSSIFDLLRRPVYRGQVVWNQTRKRDRWGRKVTSAKSPAEWITIDAPELRIISEDLWRSVQQRLTRSRRVGTSSTGGQPRVRDVESAHLLTGFARCGICNASFFPLSRSHGQKRAFFYGCAGHHTKGAAVCANGFVMRKERIDEAVLQALGGEVLRPAVVEAVLDGVCDAMRPDVRQVAVEKLRGELVKVDREMTRLVEAIAAGGEMASLMSALTARQQRQTELHHALESAERDRVSVSRTAIERQVKERLTRWRALLTGHVHDGRELLRQVLNGPIQFTPDRDAQIYRFRGEIGFDRLFAGIAGLAPLLASPSETGPRCTVELLGQAA